MMKYSLLGYVAATGIGLLICWIPYRVFLERKIEPSKSRGIILGIYCFAMILPFIASFFPSIYPATSIEFGELSVAFLNEALPDNIKQEAVISNYSWKTGLTEGYIFGVALTTVLTLISLIRLIKLHHHSEPHILNGVKVYVHNNIENSSFSWIKGIYLYKDTLNLSQCDQQTLLLHEKAHIRKLHYIDLIIAQCILIFQWFNPAAWFFKVELQRVHEYEADAEVLASGVEEKAYQNLLIDNISMRQYSGLTDGLNNCSLKKRIIMMKNKKPKRSLIGGLSPLIICAMAAGIIVNIPAVASNLKSENTKNTSLTMEANPRKITNEETSSHKSITSYVGVYTAVEVMPMYAGSSDPTVLLEALAKSIKYPENAAKKGIEGRPIVKFTVKKDGTLADFKLVRSVNPELDNAAIEAIKGLPQKWTPGLIEGKAVDCYFTLPVSFKIPTIQ